MMVAKVYHGGGIHQGGGGFGGSAVSIGEVALVYGANVDINLNLGDVYYLNLVAGSCQLNNPLNATPGKKFLVRLVQPAGGNGLVTFDTKYKFSTVLPLPVLSIVANSWDVLAFMYNSPSDSFDFVGLITGFV